MNDVRALSGDALRDAFLASLWVYSPGRLVNAIDAAIHSTNMSVVYVGTPNIWPAPVAWSASIQGAGFLNTGVTAGGSTRWSAVMRCYLLHVAPKPPRVSLLDRFRGFFKKVTL